jgi:hypothetical protein
MLKSGVAVEKLEISEIGGSLGDRKCLAESRTSFVGHRNAIVFLLIFPERVFQQPQAITLFENRVEGQ